MPNESKLYPALPDDIPKTVWSKWPLKDEAHIAYGVRKRVITTRVANGTLPVWACPDSTVRISSDVLNELFRGIDSPKPPGPGESLRVARQKLTNDDLELEDPVVGMFRECRMMLREEREHLRAVLREEREHFREQLKARDHTNAEQLKLLTAPVQTATKLLEDQSKSLATRVQFLEERQDSVIAERELMADFRHEREAQVQQIQAREKRRNEIVELLKKELGPVLVNKLGGGDSLAAFVAGVRPELIELLLQSGELSPPQAEKLQAIAERLRKEREQKAAAPAAEPPAAATSNGAAGAQN